MSLRQWFLAAVPWVLGAALWAVAAQDLGARLSESARLPRPAGASGILTDRLTPKDLRRWKAIERSVFADDARGQPRYPTLRGLWEWAAASSHAIYIEIVRSSHLSTCTAGSFGIEWFDPQAEHHLAVIRLHLSNIDQAYVGPSVARADGFIPFAGLSREERYLEVLGHELAHATHILSCPVRARMVEELVEQTNEMLLLRRARRQTEPLEQEMRQRLTRRDIFLKDLEEYAEAIETAVWRELVSSHETRERQR